MGDSRHGRHHPDVRPHHDRRPAGERAGERRVALVPDVVRRLGDVVDVVVEAGAGAGALIPDELYEAAGARLGDPWGCDVVVKVAPPTPAEIGRLRQGAVLIGFLDAPETRAALATRNITAFAMEAIPRISRAQAVDALSSQSTLAGYKAVILAAEHATRLLPMMTTAAGTLPPARVLVLGAGVAGLQASRPRTGSARGRPATTSGPRRPSRSLRRRRLARARHRGRRRGRLCARADRRRARGPAAGAHRRDQDLRHRHHDRAGPGPPGAAPGDRGGRRGHAAGQRDRRPRRRDRRQLRADRARAGRRSSTASRSPRRWTWRRACPSTPPSSTPATCRRCSS